MGYKDIMKRAPGLVVVWIFSILLTILIGIFYIIQTSYINKRKGLPPSNPAYMDTIRNLGNTVAGIGIIMCVAGAVWIVLLVGLVRNARNIWADASSIYVSRSNIVANFLTKDGSGPAGIPISSSAPNDGHSTCQAGFQVTDDPQSYDAYREMIARYQASETGKPVPQYYQSMSSLGSPALPGVQTTPHDDNMDNQRKLSLAYYRFLYCTKSYFQDIVNKNGIDQMTFLTSTVRQNLIGGHSSCNLPGVPDTQACQTPATPGTLNCTPNPCFVALNQTIAAQCLLYDDRVYLALKHQGAKGALASMEVLGNPMGYQVPAPA